MNCKKHQINISAYLDNELDEKGKIILFRHLEVCPECRKFHDSFGNIDEMLKLTAADKSEFQFEDEIWKAVNVSITKKQEKAGLKTIMKFFWPIAAVLVFSLIIFAWKMNSGQRLAHLSQNTVHTGTDDNVHSQLAANMTVSVLFNNQIKSNREKLEEKYAELAAKQLLQF